VPGNQKEKYERRKIETKKINFIVIYSHCIFVVCFSSVSVYFYQETPNGDQQASLAVKNEALQLIFFPVLF